MTTLTFDTLKFVETLTTADFTEKQAKAVSSAFREVFDARLDELVTKRDLEVTKRDLEFKLAETELRLIKWVVGSGGVIVALIKLIP
ncbi:MAG: CCDC90 family protein [Magnetococcus sp. YQC-5]